MRSSPIGVFFAIVRALQLVAVLSTIPPLSLFAVRTSRGHEPAPYQLIFALAICLVSFIHIVITLLLHLCAALHYRAVLALDVISVLLFTAGSVLLGLPLAKLSCDSVPDNSKLPRGSSPSFLSAPAPAPGSDRYSQWIHSVRTVCRLSRWAWYGMLVLSVLHVVSASCAAKMCLGGRSASRRRFLHLHDRHHLSVQRRQAQAAREMREGDSEEFMPVVRTPGLDRVLSEGEERSLGEEIERGLEWRYRRDHDPDHDPGPDNQGHRTGPVGGGVGGGGEGSMSPGLGSERRISQGV